MSDWNDMLTDADRAVMARGKWAQKAGVGERPALILIDCQYYMSGIRGANDNAEKYPLACGEVAFAATDQMKRLLDAARAAGIPVIYTRFVVDPVNDDVGMFHRKIGAGVGRGENLYFAGTHGAEITDDLKPLPTEIVLDKKKKSAFFGTPLISLLIDRRVDTCIIVGGSTSNCVRATVVDSEQYNFFTVIPEEAVYDRLPLAHKVNLFDMNRSYGDVMPVDDVLAYLGRVKAARSSQET
ncbi:isochorismatase family protein [Tabrizicola sp. BL-A-41-H6]|uniref:isochorismatase family protein n=1 Tax=Tabrizicola sp. BL-A-41-H6 TaxID=3421107 RepID=UPI003D67F8FE